MIKKIINTIKYLYFIKKNIKVGKGTRILTKFTNFGSEPYLVEIGEYCVITSGVKFLTHDTSIEVPLRLFENVVEEENGYLNKTKFGRIKIGNNCFIGVNSIILPNVKIGDNVIIAAGSVISKDIPSNAVYGGVPAKEICSIEEYYKKIKSNLTIVENSKLDMRKQELTNKLDKF